MNTHLHFGNKHFLKIKAKQSHYSFLFGLLKNILKNLRNFVKALSKLLLCVCVYNYKKHAVIKNKINIFDPMCFGEL